MLLLVFEYAEAGDLKRQLRKAREKEARFDERVIWKYFSQIAAGGSLLSEGALLSNMCRSNSTHACKPDNAS